MLNTMKRPADSLIHKNALIRGVFFGLGVVFFGVWADWCGRARDANDGVCAIGGLLLGEKFQAVL